MNTNSPFNNQITNNGVAIIYFRDDYEGGFIFPVYMFLADRAGFCFFEISRFSLGIKWMSKTIIYYEVQIIKNYIKKTRNAILSHLSFVFIHPWIPFLRIYFFDDHKRIFAILLMN